MTASGSANEQSINNQSTTVPPKNIQPTVKGPTVNRPKLSCFLIIKDEADRIEGCLKELSGWVDQLVILDSGSTDGTVELAKQYSDEVHSTDWPGYGPQRNRALARCKYDWVLNLDADEVFSQQLRDEIDATLADPNLNANLILIPWLTYFMGRPLRRGRYSTPQGKLFHKIGAKFQDSQVHETLIMKEKRVKVLKSSLVHHSWRSYAHAQEKHLKYANFIAQQKFDKGKRANGISFAVVRFFVDFLQQYIIRGGIFDGPQGFLMALVLGQYAFHKYAALWDLTLKEAEQHRNQK